MNENTSDKVKTDLAALQADEILREKTFRTDDMKLDPDKPITYKAGAKLGTLSNEAQRNHGIVIHALPDSIQHFGHGKALCGAEPGRKSLGWGIDYPIDAISCKRCLANEKLRGVI